MGKKEIVKLCQFAVLFLTLTMDSDSDPTLSSDTLNVCRSHFFITLK